MKRRLEQNQTSFSQTCTKCIDEGHLWCPTSNYKAGFCCSGLEVATCPRATTCSDDFELPELQYMLCPNEDGCFYDRNIAPETDDSVEIYNEQIGGEFFIDDVCSFIIKNPSSSDFNDLMKIRVEYYENCEPVLVKGTSLFYPIAMYEMKIG